MLFTLSFSMFKNKTVHSHSFFKGSYVCTLSLAGMAGSAFPLRIADWISALPSRMNNMMFCWMGGRKPLEINPGEIGVPVILLDEFHALFLHPIFNQQFGF